MPKKRRMPDVDRGAPRDHEAMIHSSLPTVAIRAATHDDDAVLAELARLDSADPLKRPALLGSVDGAPAAAMSLVDGRVVADPFRPTDDVVALLREQHSRARRTGRARRRRLARTWRPRPAV